MSPSTACHCTREMQSTDSNQSRPACSAKVTAGQKHHTSCYCCCCSPPSLCTLPCSFGDASCGSQSDPSSGTTPTTAKRRRRGSLSADHSTTPSNLVHDNPVVQSCLIASGAFGPESSSENGQVHIEVPDIDDAAPNVCEFIKGCLYFTWTFVEPVSTTRTTYLTVDQYLHYVPFFSDFGPFNLAHIVRFWHLMRERLQLAKLQQRVLCLYTISGDDTKRANAAFAMACYMMIEHQLPPEDAYRPLENVHPPFRPYRDASFGPSVFDLSILDCLKGLYRGLQHGLVRLDRFDVNEYEYHEKVANGDFNWITPNIIAFAAPIETLTYRQVQEHARDAAIQHHHCHKTCSPTALASDSPSSTEQPFETSNPDSSTQSSLSNNSNNTSPRSSSLSDTPSAIDPLLSTPSTGVSTPVERETNNGSSPLVPTGNGNGMSDNQKDAEQELSPVSGDAVSLAPAPLECAQTVQSDQAIEKKRRRRTTIKPSFQSLLDYFEHQAHVEVVVRLNEETYDTEFFTARGMKHVEMSFPDGSCPPPPIMRKFLALCDLVIGHKTSQAFRGNDINEDQGFERTSVEEDQGYHQVKQGRGESPMKDVDFRQTDLMVSRPPESSGGVLAVHCKAGLGRTGTLIAVYLMRTYGMTAREAIGYLRIMRPGSVVGSQQTWLQVHEAKIFALKEKPLGPVVEQCRRLLGRSHPFLAILWSDDEDSDDNNVEEDSDKEESDEDDETNDEDEDEEEYAVGFTDTEEDDEEDESDDRASASSESVASDLDSIDERGSLASEDHGTQGLDQTLASLEDAEDGWWPPSLTIPIQPRKSAAHDMCLDTEQVGTEAAADRDPLSSVARPPRPLSPPPPPPADGADSYPNMHLERRELAR